MSDPQRSHLLLLVKSLTQNRKDKNYLITIQNHNSDSPLNIDQSFTHNYEYVYKLWPCQAAERELIKISMFEKVSKDGATVLVKRGEAAPLVKYSQQGERFQFYGSFDEKCVLVLKFRVDSKQRREEKMQGGQQQKKSGSLDRHLPINKDQSLSYKNYLEQANRILKTLSAHPQQESTNSEKKHKIAGSLYHPKPKNRTHPKPQEETLRKVPQMNSLDNVQTAQKILTRDRYLNSSIDLNPSHSRSQRQSSPEQQETQEINNEESKVPVLQNNRDLDVGDRMEMSRYIQRRRQKYLGKQIEPISQPQESHFVHRLHLNNEKVNRSTRVSTSERHQPIQFVNSFADKQPTAPQSITKQQSKRSLRSSKASPLTLSIAEKKEQTKQSPSNSAIIRAEDFPAKSSNIAEGKLHGSIRRKKTTNSRSKLGIQPIIEEPVSPPHSQPFEPNITHYSIHSKIGDRVEHDSYNLTLSNFKAILYAGNKTHPKKLVIVFQDSRYSTQINNCVSLTTEWHQCFCIRSCKKHSYVYFKLISVGPKEREEGESQVVANDIINSANKVHRSYIFCDDLAVGYLQFQHKHTQIKSEEKGWKREAERNSISLPQLKKKMDASHSSKRRSSLQNRLEPSRNNDRARQMSHKYPSGIPRSVQVEGYPCKHQLKDRLGQGGNKGMKSKIKEKKMMLKAKLK